MSSLGCSSSALSTGPAGPRTRSVEHLGDAGEAPKQCASVPCAEAGGRRGDTVPQRPIDVGQRPPGGLLKPDQDAPSVMWRQLAVHQVCGFEPIDQRG